MSTAGSAIGHEFMEALADNRAARYEALLTEDAGLRIWNWEGNEALRPRDKVIGRLLQEWSRLENPALECLSMTASEDRVAIEFRIRTHTGACYRLQNGSAFLTLGGARIEVIDLYYARPVPAGPPTGWIAPQTLSFAELEQLILGSNSFDLRLSLPQPLRYRLMPDLAIFGIDASSPAINGVELARLSEAEADARIEEIIALFRAQGIGFHWQVTPLDTPADLCERLERHGLMYAGASIAMARGDLEHLDIPINPDLTIQQVDGRDPGLFDQAARITGDCFHMSADEFDKWRAFWLDELVHPSPGREELAYLALLHGRPVASARLILGGGFAHLSSAGTLPQFRGRRAYSTLLKRRLEDARRRGYQIATIDAGPMSQRVVERFGFKEYGRARIYGWMPVMDPEVIRQIVPDE